MKLASCFTVALPSLTPLNRVDLHDAEVRIVQPSGGVGRACALARGAATPVRQGPAGKQVGRRGAAGVRAMWGGGRGCSAGACPSISNALFKRISAKVSTWMAF